MSKVNLGDWGSAFTHDAKGGSGTVDRAAQTFKRVQEFVKKQDWGKDSISPANITTKQIRQFIQSRVAAGLAPDTIANEAAHLRRACAGAGRQIGDLGDPKNNWSNSRIGVPEAEPSRCRMPIKPDVLAYAMERLKTNNKAVLGLQVTLGLRVQEAVKATNLSEWKRAFGNARDGVGVDLRLTADGGPKGGRARSIFVPPEKVDAARAAVSAAWSVRSANNALIATDEKYKACNKNSLVLAKNLEDAIASYSNATRYRGMTGDNSTHGVRRAWAVEQLAHYESTGLSRDESLTRLSNDLGHGDGRGRWVEANYINGKEEVEA